MIHQSAISNTITAHYQSAVSYDIICTGMNCAMIWYNSLLECSVYCRNTSHLIPFQQLGRHAVHTWCWMCCIKDMEKDSTCLILPTALSVTWRLQTQAIAHLGHVFIWGNCPPSQKIFEFPADFPLLSGELCQSGWLAWVCFHDIPN